MGDVLCQRPLLDPVDGTKHVFVSVRAKGGSRTTRTQRMLLFQTTGCIAYPNVRGATGVVGVGCPVLSTH